MLGLPGIRYLSQGQQGQSALLDIEHTEIHDVVPADSAVVNNNVPCPESYCIPLCSSVELAQAWWTGWILPS